MTDDKGVEELVHKARKICHDINQPLTVIMARSELMLLKVSPGDNNRKAVEQIHEQAEKASQLVESLRALLKDF
ncbi:MAG: histidine kinase dimerization/phospho-acceptor domain-containing protein [Pseudomonadota bacterium]